MALAVGVLVTGSLAAASRGLDRTVQAVQIGSSGGCLFAPETCPADEYPAGTVMPGGTALHPSPTGRPPEGDGTATVPAAASTSASESVGEAAVTYRFAERTRAGYVVSLRITNISATTWPGWALRFRLAQRRPISSFWNTELSVRGDRLTAHDDGWNASVEPGASVEFGIEGRGSFQPSGCVLNGNPCRFG